MTTKVLPPDWGAMGEAAKLFTRSLMMGLDSAVRKNEFAELTAEDVENLPYAEAVEYLKKRDVIKKVDYNKLSDKMRFRAFTASRIADGDLLKRINSELIKNVNDGKGLKDFLSLTKTDILNKVGMGAGGQGWYWETVYRTNVQTAYNTGRMMGFEEDKPLALHFVGIEDARQTDVCHSLSNVIRPYDDPLWEKYIPPLHFGCRSTVRAIYDEDELPDEWSSLEEIEKPAKGFGTNPLENDSWWNELSSQVARAKEYGVQGEIEAAKEILIEHKSEAKNAMNFKSVDDFKKYMLDNITDEIDLDIKQSDLPVLNNIANLLNQRLTEYGLPKFTKITNVRNGNVLASIEDDVLKLNISKLKNPSSVLQRLEDYEKKYGFRHSVLGDKDDVIRSTLDHELGHRVYANSSLGNKQKTLTDLFAKGTKWQAPFDIARDVSYYAYQGGESETIAELFSMYKHPLEIKKMPLEYKNFVKDLIRNTTKNKIKMEEQFLTLTEKQFGKKGGKHASEFGLKMELKKDREKFKDIILDIYNNADYTLGNGEWRGQPKPVTFYVKGNDVVVVSADDEFITILKGGVNNARVISARLKNAGK
ncbi:MAG: minor capsid protein [Treponema sp.]|nr:minor capsid protein [Treponema sp.]